MGLFSRKNKGVEVSDVVFISPEAKLDAMATLASGKPSFVFIFWFEQSKQDAELFFNKKEVNPECYMAREIHPHHINNKNVVFGEHFPLRSKEQTLFEELKLSKVVVYSSLTDPLLKLFGGEKIIELMKTLGLAENEAMEHKMISKSIANAQEKLEKKVLMEQGAVSAEDWFKKNTVTGH